MIYVNSVNVSPSSVTIKVGDWYYGASATVCTTDASCKNVRWHSDNTSVATVSTTTGYIYANAAGTAKIYAMATDGSGACDGCTVTVIGDVLVNSVKVSPYARTMLVGESIYLRETILPANATNKCVEWSSSNTYVATVNQDSGLVYAQNPGTAIIYATACNGRETRGGAIIKVEALVPVESIAILPEKTTISPDKTANLSAKILPENATNKAVIWRSSNTRIATVKDGIVTGLKGGTVTITARTVDGNFSDTCEVTVDPREKVTIRKDSDSFYIQFLDGAIWKNVGYDVSNTEEYIPQSAKDRLNKNLHKYFTEKQLAFVYLFDPLGVEHYVKYYYLNHNVDAGGLLRFKDDVYEAILGVRPGKFTLTEDGEKITTGIPSKRLEYYTDAEILFGAHDPEGDIGEVIFKNLFDLVVDIFEYKCESFSTFLSAFEMCKVLFYSSWITDSLNSASGSLSSLFVEDYIETANGNEEKRKAALNIMGVVGIAITAITSFSDKLVDQIENLDLSIQKILPKINSQNDYRACIIVDGKEKTVDDVIEYCYNNSNQSDQQQYR